MAEVAAAPTPNREPPPEPAPNPQNNANRPLITINRTRNHNQLVHIRDRLFHTLFYRGALTYARIFPKPVRRFIEFMVLIQTFVAFFMLIYIHLSFSKTANTCLDGVVSNWPKDGILRVEIIRNMKEGYSLQDSYAKEESLSKMEREDGSTIFSLLTSRLDLEPSKLEHNMKDKRMKISSKKQFSEETQQKSYANDYLNVTSTKWSWREMFTEVPKHPEFDLFDREAEDEFEANSSYFELENDSDFSTSKLLSKKEIYIFEYALEYGFLRLSPAARAKLNIPVKAVFLDPLKDECFGDSLTRLLLGELLGYNDLLMTSVKAFAEKEQNRGFLKNVVTGEHYRFVNLWMAKTAYIPAIVCMLIFVSILLLWLFTQDKRYFRIDVSHLF